MQQACNLGIHYVGLQIESTAEGRACCELQGVCWRPAWPGADFIPACPSNGGGGIALCSPTA